MQRQTEAAVERVNELPDEDEEAQQLVVMEWAESILNLGVEVKGLWLVDFDNGEGYYCWCYPEETITHYHGYQEGFAGRMKIH